MEACKRCDKVPECGEAQCEFCRQWGCDYCVPETDSGHSICFKCLEVLERAGHEQLRKRIAELELENKRRKKTNQSNFVVTSTLFGGIRDILNTMLFTCPDCGLVSIGGGCPDCAKKEKGD